MGDTILLKRLLVRLGADFCSLLRALRDILFDIFRIVAELGRMAFVSVRRIDWRAVNRRYIIVGAVALVAVVLLLVGVATCGGNGETADDTPSFAESERVERPLKAHRVSNIRYGREFNDLNNKQLAAARAIGISPIATREDIASASRRLVEIDDFDAYAVDKLTHSVPYLVPEAADLLAKIGRNFQDSLVMKHLPPCKIIVTSVLRTRDDVKRLGRGNVNSSKNSAHFYGTTFDIAHGRFQWPTGESRENAARLKAVLGEVLRDLRKAGYCYVKHEVKQACFHITARRSPE